MCIGTCIYSYFEGSMHLHLLPILGMGCRGPLEKRASPFLGKGRHLRTVPKVLLLILANLQGTICQQHNKTERCI